jgi:hypothetical protein
MLKQEDDDKHDSTQLNHALGPVGIQDSHPGVVVIQAADGPIRFD